jgi:hypothetical protein
MNTILTMGGGLKRLEEGYSGAKILHCLTRRKGYAP